MLNTVYRLVAQKQFELAFNNIDLCEPEVIVRPTYMSICHADQRYYQGLRPESILTKKLPMALIHEAVGEIVYDPEHKFKTGDSVVLIPNTPIETDTIIGENYLESSRFRASEMDGFMQDNIAMNRERLIQIPKSTNKLTASFTELATVCVQAIQRFDSIAHSRRKEIGIWGDGNLSYILAVFLKAIYPNMKLYIFGIYREKLSHFVFADEIYNVQDIPEDVSVDHAFECVGGNASQNAINQIIRYIRPEGTLSLLGVSEYPIPLNTRMVLEKGLRIYGSSRSGRADFEKTVKLYETNPEILRYLSNIVGAQVEVNSIQDITKAFELDICKKLGKTIMIWKL